VLKRATNYQNRQWALFLLDLLPAGIFQVAVIIRDLLSERFYIDDHVTQTRYLLDFMLINGLHTDATLH
jgi:hypothetical protein